MISKETKTAAIATNLEMLEAILREANTRASEAVEAIKQGNQNGAIGAALGIEEMLQQATALYGAATALHRM